MYLPLETNSLHPQDAIEPSTNPWTEPKTTATEEIALQLKTLLIQAGIPAIDDNVLLESLVTATKVSNSQAFGPNEMNYLDFGQSESEFINAYNALTRLSPLPTINSSSVPNGNQLTTERVEPLENLTAITNELEVIAPNNALPVQTEVVIVPEVAQVKDALPLRPTTKVEQKRASSRTNFKHKQQLQAIVQKTAKALQNNHPKDQRVTASADNNKSNKSSRIISDLASLKAGDEKSNNLNDIVGNTQKLIQQMKDEINSDINSMDDRNTSDNSLVSENSSHDDDFSSEHESSYSESEGHTEGKTSDEEFSSEEEEEEPEQKTSPSSQKSSVPINRTSSEENEQFEEALDHIEEQMEDFKKSNFEVLDSIARSLQEEHVISVEVNPPKSTSTKKRQDFNNNFTAVKSFEEIYDDLNEEPNVAKSSKTSPQVGSEETASFNDARNTPKESNSAVQVYTKQELVLLHVNVASPIQLQITENKPLSLNAIISSSEHDYGRNNNNFPVDVINEADIDIVHETANQSDKDSEQSSEESGSEESESDSSEMPELEEKHKSPSPQLENISQVINAIAATIEIANQQDPSVQRASSTPDAESVTIEIANQPDPIVRQASTTPDSTTKNNLAFENDNTHEEPIIPTVPVSKSADSTSTTIAKTIPPLKSSIPKPVRISQQQKQKVEKTISKVIASKVPVRRNSIKQYPAPAPPKSTFGSVSNGTVRQLQTRLFNKPKVTVNLSALTTAAPQSTPKPSTSTMSKKKQAPAPPTKAQDPNKKPPTPPSASPPKVKPKSFFRETCRTEDEWTESDSEDSQANPRPVRADEPQRAPPTPPPPITVRRVSGQVIDLAAVRLPEGSPERQARMLLAEGATETWEQARIAVELVSRGAEPPAALLAALECADLPSALAYLYQDCELCASRLPEHEMVSMFRCTHRCCRECARHYFTVQITERSIADCVCAFCKEPELESLPEDEWLEYFAHLDILLKTLLDAEVHELFQRKLRDRTLALDPNFRWCVECSSGFFVHPKQKKLRCPECRSVSCATCRKPWSANHEGLTCEQYTAWLEDNDPERSVAAVQQHLRENGLECPRCHFKYSLSRGGCMHFTCTQCKYEFCYGCGKPFMMGARCGLSEYCAKLGLHAHHPRNCLFYLRDKEPHELQTLLQMNDVSYETEAGEGATNRCPIQLQRETPAGLVDGTCGADVPPKHAGLCNAHYVEYLAGLARGLDPIPVMALSELIAELRRRALPLPERGPWDTDPIYAGMCAEIVKEKIPLD